MGSFICYWCVSVCVCVSYSLLKGPRCNDILVAMRLLNAGILVSKYHSPQKGATPCGNGCFQGMDSKTQKETGTSFCNRK